MFQNDLSDTVLRQFMASNAKEVYCCEVIGTMMCVAQIEHWIATVVTGLTEMEQRGGHRENLCADMYDSMLTLANKQLIGNRGGFVRYWDPEKR